MKAVEEIRKDKSYTLLGEMNLSKYVLFGNEIIELDESMFQGEEYLCPECKQLGYCKRLTNSLNELLTNKGGKSGGKGS